MNHGNGNILTEGKSHQWIGGILGIPQTETCDEGGYQTGKIAHVLGEYILRYNHRNETEKKRLGGSSPCLNVKLVVKLELCPRC